MNGFCEKKVEGLKKTLRYFTSIFGLSDVRGKHYANMYAHIFNYFWNLTILAKSGQL